MRRIRPCRYQGGVNERPWFRVLVLQSTERSFVVNSGFRLFISNFVIAILLVMCTSNTVWAQETTVVHAGWLLAVPGTPAQERQSIIIRDGRVDEVFAGFVDINSIDGDVILIDLSDKFVMPGLIDAHVHFMLELGPNEQSFPFFNSKTLVAMRGAGFAKKTLEVGFTTVRDLGGDSESVFALRDAIARGYIPGPRIVAAGTPITATGGHGDSTDSRGHEASTSCNGEDDCLRAVRLAIKNGADVIKIGVTGGVFSNNNTGTGLQMRPEELRIIVETAHSLGRQVAAHAHDADGINAALVAGVDSIEHGSFSDGQSFKLFREMGAFLVPTLIAGERVYQVALNTDILPPAMKEKALQVAPVMVATTRAAHEAGVKIAFGTDSAVAPHGSNPQEFLMLLRAGLTAEESLIAATVNAAALLGLEKEIGSIERHKYADVIAVDSNPLDDLNTMLNVVFVMKSGNVIKQ
jgi:imidazolonepropionase-like amidohydrolase